MNNIRITFLVLFLWCAVTSLNAEYRDHRNRSVDSLETVLSGGAALSDEQRMFAYMDLMAGYLNTDGIRAKDYALKTLALSYKMKALNAREAAYYNLGLLAYGSDDYDSAIDFFEKAIAVTDSMKDDNRYDEITIDNNLSQLYGALGNLYNVQDQALLAIDYYQRALPVFERHNWLQSQCILYYNVGELYLSMSNMKKAEENFADAMEKGRASGDSLMMALAGKGLTKIYLATNQEQVEETLLPSFSYFKTHRHEEPQGYAEVLAAMARLNLIDGHRNLTAAKKYVDEALTFTEGEMMTEVYCDIYAAATEVAMAQQNWRQALQYGQKSVRPKGEESFSDVGCYQQLAIISTELNDKTAAQCYINKVCELMTRFSTKNYQSGISQMEVLYETEKKQAAINQLAKEKRLFMWSSILGGIVLLLVVVLFFVMWRSVKLERRNATMKAKIDGEISERMRIARDLHDRLGGLLTAIKFEVELSSAAVKLTDEAIVEMRNVAHHLLPDSLRRFGLRRALGDFCLTMKNVSFSFVGKEERLDKQHEEVLYCCVYELVNNAVKSSGATRITVQLIADEDYTAVNVTDNGNGEVSLDDEKGAGLRNIRERVELIGGRFDLYAKPNEGTEVNIELKRVL